ncbi:MAG TPA: hypothetical protein PKW14_08565 [Bacteroidota bacterium]|jgi:hypothetical protein|nr:hypothetical protein [Bacteroidota bacterium]
MDEKGKYSNAEYQINLISEFKSKFESELEKCSNIENAMILKNKIIEEFNTTCESNILKNFFSKISEELINEKFKL